MKQKQKCIALYLSKEQTDAIKKIKQQSSKNQKQIIEGAVSVGLKKESLNHNQKKIYLVTTRIDTERLDEMMLKLQSGELDMSAVLFTFCRKEDPTVGINIWIAENKKQFETLFAPHAALYKEIIKIEEVTTPQQALQAILDKQ